MWKIIQLVSLGSRQLIGGGSGDAPRVPGQSSTLPMVILPRAVEVGQPTSGIGTRRLPMFGGDGLFGIESASAPSIPSAAAPAELAADAIAVRAAGAFAVHVHPTDRLADADDGAARRRCDAAVARLGRASRAADQRLDVAAVDPDPFAARRDRRLAATTRLRLRDLIRWARASARTALHAGLAVEPTAGSHGSKPRNCNATRSLVAVLRR